MPPGPRPGEVYFFLHLLKTGGTSFLGHIADNFPPELRYPYELPTDDDEMKIARYRSMAMLREGAAGTPRPVIYSGHFPLLAADVIRPDVTITILREPVERAISTLRQIQGREGPEPRSLEELYEHHNARWSLVQDYQVRQFALTQDELVEAAAEVDQYFPGGGARAMDVPQLVPRPVDDARLARAIDNLASVELVGLQSSYPELLEELRTRYGWTIRTMHRHRVASGEVEVPAALRRRIAEDSAADLEFYAAAERLVASRRR